MHSEPSACEHPPVTAPHSKVADYDRLCEGIARLQTEPLLRARFSAAPQATASMLGLSPKHAAQLALLPPRSLSILDAMALFHRWTRLQEHLTWLDPHRRPVLEPLLSRYLNEHPPELLNRDDALAFCGWGERLAHTPMTDLATRPDDARLNTEQDSIFQTLCRFERLSLEVAWGLGGHPKKLTVRFEHPVQALQAWFQAHETGWPEEPHPSTRQPVLITFIKVPTLPAVQVQEEIIGKAPVRQAPDA